MLSTVADPTNADPMESSVRMEMTEMNHERVGCMRNMAMSIDKATRNSGAQRYGIEAFQHRPALVNSLILGIRILTALFVICAFGAIAGLAGGG